ncbi:MAG: hypothetical protein NC307_03270 [Roseburia sp.]|nr:hypothetical protein [Roseburia sp.]
MLPQVKGIVRGNTVVIEDDNIQEYDGTEVIVTMLEYRKKQQKQQKQKPPIDWESFRMPSERGDNVEEYMKEMRENDRM